MSQSKRSITVAVIFGATLALGAVAAWGQELPSPPTQQSYSGSDLFKTYCAACHGTSARGDGPLAANMKKPPPDLTQFAARNGGTFPSAQVAQIIDGRQPISGHGGPDMPVWGDAFKASYLGSSEESVQARIKALVEYLERIQERRAQ
jgi:mono/diheme cytochrome c family protein